MKKFILCVCCAILSVLPSYADISPYSVSDINTRSIGVYQAENIIKIYEKPDEKSPLLLTVNWNETGITSPEIKEQNIFVAFYPNKNLGFMTVMDESEDLEWVQILYDQNKLGWIKKDDPYKYTNWRTFYNNYGRKYGLKYLKGTSSEYKKIYSSPETDSQILSTFTLPKAIKLNSVSGNWVLAIIYDIDNSQKIGWLQWRTINGEIFLFPQIR